MTIVKRPYIVGEFMHLRYEAKLLMWSILIPMSFVVWMLVAFVYEGMKIPWFAGKSLPYSYGGLK